MLNIERKFWAGILITIFWFSFIFIDAYFDLGFPDSILSKVYGVGTVILSIIVVEIYDYHSSKK